MPLRNLCYSSSELQNESDCEVTVFILLKVLSLLNAGGAKQDTYLSEMVSHVISDDPSQDEYSEAKELFELPVVKVRNK